MDYQEALRLLYSLGHEVSAVKFGLEGPRTLCAALGHPEATFPAVHIGGTNGKGSTAATLHSILSTAQLRVGCYTSPHLVSLCERIRIGREWISESDFASRITEVEQTVRQLMRDGTLKAHPTFFEMVTAAMFVHLARAQVPLGILEVGLGGRLDATNVCRSLVSVITSLSMDHQAYLGNRLEEIAFEKAGILRAGTPVLLGPVHPSAEAVVKEQAAKVGAPFRRLEDWATIGDVVVHDGCYRFTLQTSRRSYRLCSSLRGPQQPVNTAMAVLAAEMLQDAGYPITSESIEEGVRQTWWPGRFQVVRENPRLILDGAHNLEAMANLARLMAEWFPRGDLHLIFGAVGDKDYPQMGEMLLPLARNVILTRSENPRAVLPERLREIFEPHYSGRIQIAATVGEAIDRAIAEAESDSWILLTGSLYMVGEALAHLGLSAITGCPTERCGQQDHP